ncbi:MAG: protocatechuate 3,4-dioxygenase subunit alpha [Bryobacteraceae bacterium]|jgi:protocatechuate 3,4-dioxygenase alpha subunit
MIPSPYCTIGPFFPGEFVAGCQDLTSFQGKQARGQHIVLTGRVVEEGNRPILNAIVEIWQPDAQGVFRHPLDPHFMDADPGFFGWGRARTDAAGRYSFQTVMPGSSNGYGNHPPRSPHVNLMLLAIGLTRRLVTTVFFAETPESVRDPVLDCVPDPAGRSRMLARRESDRNGAGGVPVYRFDIVTRGDSETPFFID